MARVTILMAVFNSAETISECIESILNQSFQDFKLLVVNDLSTDNTVEIIESFQSDKIEIINFKTKGFINALNTGLDKINTDYIARMDSDDIMLPNKLKTQIAFMDSHLDIAACGSYVETFGNYKTKWTRFRKNKAQLKRNFFWFNSINNPSSIIRNSVIKENNIRYNRNFAYIDGDKDYALSEDFKFWTDLLKVGDLTNIPEVLLRYRVHDKQTSTSKRKIQTYVANRVRREAIVDFLGDNGFEIEPIRKTTDKEKLFHKIKNIKPPLEDRWHLAMTQYMLIQSCPDLKFWRFLKLLVTTRFVIDRNILELCWKMIRTKSGMDEKPMI